MTTFLSYDADLDWIEVAPYGVVLDRQGHDRWHGVCDRFGYFLDAPDGQVIGFRLVEVGEFDPDAPELATIFEGPRFTVPVLALVDATAGEVVLAARGMLGGESTLDRRFFDVAVASEGEEALAHWVHALQAGCGLAHYGAGYTLLELGRPREAYRHLRHYTSLVDADAWAWAYRGRAAAELGFVDEAVDCCRRALEREEVYGEETDAAELLRRLVGAER